MRSNDTLVHLALFSKADGPLNKTIEISDDRKPVSDANECYSTSGVAQNQSILGLAGLTDLNKEMTSADALSLGTINDRNDDDPVPLTTKERLSGGMMRLRGQRTYSASRKVNPVSC